MGWDLLELLGPQIMGQNNLGSKSISDPKKFLDQKDFGSKTIWGLKNFGPKKDFGSKKF